MLYAGSAIKIADLTAEADPPPELDVGASAKIKDSAVEFARCPVGSTVELEKALFVGRVTTAHRNIR